MLVTVSCKTSTVVLITLVKCLISNRQKQIGKRKDNVALRNDSQEVMLC